MAENDIGKMLKRFKLQSSSKRKAGMTAVAKSKTTGNRKSQLREALAKGSGKVRPASLDHQRL